MSERPFPYSGFLEFLQLKVSSVLNTLLWVKVFGAASNAWVNGLLALLNTTRFCYLSIHKSALQLHMAAMLIK